MTRSFRLWLLVGLAAVAVTIGVVSAVGSNSSFGTTNLVLENALAVEQGQVAPTPHRMSVSGGVVYAALDFSGALDRRADTVAGKGKLKKKAGQKGSAGTQGCQNTFAGGGPGGKNVRVNQDCSLRRQAEEVIAIDPNNPEHLIAGQNDSRIGFNHCGYDWSFDGGKTWGDQLPPFYQFLLGDGHTADACSDPTATFDSKGNAYIGGVLFDINSAASAFIVMKSNADAGGSFYHTPAPLSFQEYRDTPVGVVASDNDPNVLHDKEFIVADANKSDPNRPDPKADNVYATWTRFDFDSGGGIGAHSPIYFSQSTDGGATWSPGIEISGANATFCTVASGEADPNACDQDQGSDPIVGPDGTVYVSFFNGNTPNLGENQHLLVRCPVANDCSLPASWQGPFKIQNDFGFQPFGPVAATACPAGRQCLPPNGYRVQDETYGSISVDASGTLYHSFSDARNLGPNCNPLGSAATATPPCDTDVYYSFSTNGGQIWSTLVKVTPAGSAQWQPWNAVAPDGKTLYVAYYDRSYGDCETTGCNDITLATIKKPATGSPSILYTRITTSSMPNLVVANNPLQAGFLGDYMWVATDSKGHPQLVWADTRGLDGTVEEDVYFASP
jgi:hypothetical protein